MERNEEKLDAMIDEIEYLKIHNRESYIETKRVREDNNAKREIIKKRNIVFSDAKLKKERKLLKIEMINKAKAGKENSFSDFTITPAEVVKCVPKTPLEGIKKINEAMQELKKILKNEAKIKDSEDKAVFIRYMGDNLSYICPDNYEYTFYELLIDACHLFEQNYEECVFKDEANYIWPMHSSVKEYKKTAKGNIQLFLAYKNIDKKEEVHYNIDDDDDGATLTIKAIDALLQKNEEQKNAHIAENDEEKIKQITSNRRGEMKANRENEIILMIEKTFGKRIVYFAFYIFFVFYTIYFVIRENNVIVPLQLVEVINNEFFQNSFNISFTTYDYYTQDETNNFNINNASTYQTYISLQDITDMTLLSDWLNDVYFEKLNFPHGLYQFMEKHKLFGAIRFFQIRQAQDECIPFSQNTEIDNGDLSDLYCFNSFEKADKNASFAKGLNAFIDEPTSEEYKFYSNCLTDGAVGTNYTNLCSFIDGFTYRPANYSYSYSGQMASYSFDGGYYFDIPVHNVDTKMLKLMNQMVSSAWLDLSTRLVAITFNAYESTNIDNRIFTTTFYIEQGNSMKLISNFDVKVFSLFINFEDLASDISEQGFKLSIIFQHIIDYWRQYLYLLLLFIYSIFTLKNEIGTLLREGRNIIYKGFAQWIISFVIGSLILTVLIMRIIFIVIQGSVVKIFKGQNFIPFFPVNYFSQNLEYIVNYMEIAMIMGIVINALNSFYSEIFSQIFLTFQSALKNLFAFYMIYIILLIAYAATANLSFGPIIEGILYNKIIF